VAERREGEQTVSTGRCAAERCWRRDARGKKRSSMSRRWWKRHRCLEKYAEIGTADFTSSPRSSGTAGDGEDSRRSHAVTAQQWSVRLPLRAFAAEEQRRCRRHARPQSSPRGARGCKITRVWRRIQRHIKSASAAAAILVGAVIEEFHRTRRCTVPRPQRRAATASTHRR